MRKQTTTTESICLFKLFADKNSPFCSPYIFYQIVERQLIYLIMASLHPGHVRSFAMPLRYSSRMPVNVGSDVCSSLTTILRTPIMAPAVTPNSMLSVWRIITLLRSVSSFSGSTKEFLDIDNGENLPAHVYYTKDKRRCRNWSEFLQGIDFTHIFRCNGIFLIPGGTPQPE